MRNRRMIVLSILTGAITGFIVLGLVGRFSMALVSALIGSRINLSVSGIVQASVIGTIIGAGGGFLYLIVGKIQIFSKISQGVVLGMVLFAISVVIATFFTKMKIDFTDQQYFMLVAAFCVYVAYGISEAVLVNLIKLKLGEKTG